MEHNIAVTRECTVNIKQYYWARLSRIYSYIVCRVVRVRDNYTVTTGNYIGLEVEP